MSGKCDATSHDVLLAVVSDLSKIYRAFIHLGVPTSASSHAVSFC